MNNEPLLSDESMEGRIGATQCLDPMDAVSVRAYYEYLLRSGKLREVKEVTIIDSDCSECGEPLDFWSPANGDWTAYNFCPGCGNPVRRDNTQEGA